MFKRCWTLVVSIIPLFSYDAPHRALRSLLTDCPACSALAEGVNIDDNASPTDYGIAALEIQDHCPLCKPKIPGQRGYVFVTGLGWLPNDLTALPLFNYGIQGLDATLAQLTKLKILILEGNNIQPNGLDVLTAMPSIQVLDLNRNNMTQLPNAIPYLTNLAGLNLDNNQLTTEALDGLSGNPNLKLLSCNNNLLTDAPAALANMPWLMLFRAENNQMQNATFSSLIGHPYFSMLRLGFNNLTSVPDGVFGMPNLHLLFLNNNHLETFLTTSMDAFDSLHELQELNLAANELTTLPPNMSGIFRVKGLILSRNLLTTSESIASLSDVTNATNIDLSENRLTTIPTNLSLPNLVKLNLSRNYLQFSAEDQSISGSTMPKLIDLDLAYCELKTLSLGIITHPTLNSIKAGLNDICPDCQTALRNAGFKLCYEVGCTCRRTMHWKK